MYRAKPRPASESAMLRFRYVLRFQIQRLVTITRRGLESRRPATVLTDTNTAPHWENIHPSRPYPLRQHRKCHEAHAYIRNADVSIATLARCVHRAGCLSCRLVPARELIQLLRCEHGR